MSSFCGVPAAFRTCKTAFQRLSAWVHVEPNFLALECIRLLLNVLKRLLDWLPKILRALLVSCVECVLAGASGAYTVCVCIMHQNVILMIEGNWITCLITILNYYFIIFIIIYLWLLLLLLLFWLSRTFFVFQAKITTFKLCKPLLARSP